MGACNAAMLFGAVFVQGLYQGFGDGEVGVE